MSIKGIISLLIRAISMVARFLLLLILSKYLIVEELGSYSLITVTLVYATALIGLDFYIYTTRVSLEIPTSQRASLVKNHLTLMIFLYALFMPLLSLLFVFEFFSIELLGYFYILLILEHLNQEAIRFLIAWSKPFAANMVLFVRTTLWIFILLPVFIYYPEYRTLKTVLVFWSAGALSSLILSIQQLSRIKISGWNQAISISWIITGLKIAIPFLLGTLALRSLSSFDRYAFEIFSSIQLVAVYAFYIGLVQALAGFLDAGVFSFFYPKLLKNKIENDESTFRANSKRMLLVVMFISTLFFLCLILMIDVLLDFINQEVYIAHKYFLYWVMSASFFQNLSQAFHYMLFAYRLDKKIMYSHYLGLFVFFVFLSPIMFFCDELISEYFIFIAINAAYFVILLFKIICCVKCIPKAN